MQNTSDKTFSWNSVFIEQCLYGLFSFGGAGLVFGVCIGIFVTAILDCPLAGWITFALVLSLGLWATIYMGIPSAKYTADYKRNIWLNIQAAKNRSMEIIRQEYAELRPFAAIPANPKIEVIRIPRRCQCESPWAIDSKELVITGPFYFAGPVLQVLDELRRLSPHRYQEALRYMPKAEYNPAYPGRMSADSSGTFKVNGSNYQSFRFIFLHELGHNVCAATSHDHSEDSANGYARTVEAELQRSR